MKTILIFLVLAIVSVTCLAQQTRYLTPDNNRTIVTLEHASETPQIEAPGWIQAEVTDGREVETDKLVSVLLIRHGSTTECRTGEVVVKFRDRTVTVQVIQAAPLNFGRDGDQLVTHRIRPEEIRRAWFVPDDGETLPDVVYRADRNATVFTVPKGRGVLWIQAVEGVFAALL